MKKIILFLSVSVMVFHISTYASNQIIDGIQKEYYPSGKLYSEVNYKEGKREGISKEYYDNGNLFRKRNYKNDKLEGIEFIYYPNGNLRQKVNYKDGKIEGIYKCYDERGNLKSIRKGHGEKATVVFEMKSNVDIRAKFCSFNPNDHRSFPRSGYMICDDLSAFPMDSIKSKLRYGKEFWTYFILDYGVINEWIPDKLFEGDRGWPLFYVGRVSKAVPFKPNKL